MVKIDKQTIIKIAIGAVVILLVGMLAGYYISSRRSVSTASQSAAAIDTGLAAASTELDSTRQQLSASQTVIEDLKRTNSDLNQQISDSRAIIDKLSQSNSDIANATDSGAAINDSSAAILARDIKILEGLSKVSQ